MGLKLERDLAGRQVTLEMALIQKNTLVCTIGHTTDSEIQLWFQSKIVFSFSSWFTLTLTFLENK